MRAILGDGRVADPTELIKVANWFNIPIAANKMLAVSGNRKHMTYLYGRPQVKPFEAKTMDESGWDDQFTPSISFDDGVKLSYPSVFDVKELTEFYESVCRVAPSTISSNTTNPEYEGPGDVVATYGCPIILNYDKMQWLLKGKYFDFDSSDSSLVNRQPPYRMLHNYRISTPNKKSFESGQVAAEGMLTRGFENCWRPFVRKPLTKGSG